MHVTSALPQLFGSDLGLMKRTFGFIYGIIMVEGQDLRLEFRADEESNALQQGTFVDYINAQLW